MKAFDLASVRSEPEGFRRNAKDACRVIQIEPRLSAIRRRPEDRDLVMRSVRGAPLVCPAIAMPGQQAIAVEDAEDVIAEYNAYLRRRGYREERRLHATAKVTISSNGRSSGMTKQCRSRIA